MTRKIALSACLVSLFTYGAVATANAQNDSPTKDIHFTFSQPVTIPNMTLPAGKYLFRHVGANTGRTILQIVREDTGQLRATIQTVQAARRTAPDRAELRFMETASNVAPAVSTWWYPGMTQGWEFVYPREQALKLAKTAKQPILTTARNVPTEEAKSEDMVRLDPSGAETPYVAGADADSVALSGTAQRGEIAVEPSANQAPASSAATSAQSTGAASGRTQLPRTASAMPLVALIGMLCGLAAVGLRISRRTTA
jgi:hypothetical protein